MTKYIFVTGGVVSGLGKGVTAASLGRLLKARGLKVTAQKEHPFFIGVQYHPEFNQYRKLTITLCKLVPVERTTP